MAIQRTEAQTAVIKNRGGTLLVSAAAGSGKTSVLVDRLLDRIVQDGKRIDQFLIITFTKAAAEELRIRIARGLTEQLREDPKNRHLQRQAVLLYNTHISTIHAFCTTILREWGHALDIPLDFSLCEEEDASIMMLQALNEILEERYESLSPDDPFASLLDILSVGRDDSRLLEIALDVYGRMQSHADPHSWMEEQKTIFSLHGISEVGETVWGKLLLADTVKIVSYWKNSISRAITLSQEEASLLGYVESLQETQAALEDFHIAATTGWDAAASADHIPFPRLKPVRNCQNPRLQDYVKLLRSQCKVAMESLSLRFSSSSQSLLEDMQLLYPAMLGLFDLIKDFSARYSQLKVRRGVLDFSDLEHKTVALLVDEYGNPTEIARQVGRRFTEIMVDEYQDTNQVQNTIFSALSDSERNLFLVGDVKQSIYRFRLADPTIFLDKYRRFAPYDQAKEGESRKILLSQNFRSRPEVLDAANFLFSNIMSEQMGEMNYTPKEALYPGGNFPEGNGYETELHVLHFEEQGEKSSDPSPGNHELEARFVADQIVKLLQAPFLVSDDKGGTRPITPEDIVILLRSPGSVRHYYSQALREAQIPWSVEEAGGFFESTEVSVLLSFLQIIDNPRQDIPLLSVLHSPLFAFDGEQLAQLRLAGDGDIYSALEAAAEAKNETCRSFLSDLASLRFESVDKSCHELIWALYQKTKALEIFSHMPAGAQRKENLLAFYELACRFEKAGHRGLFGFLFHIAKIRENGGKITKGAATETAGVKLLSIHRSKGLEYPVVFLCGLGRRFNYNDMQKPVLFHTKLGLGPRGVDTERMVEFSTLPRQAVALQLKREMLAEEMRLLYVAMTRAKEKLIMTHTLSYGEGDLKKLASSISSPIDPNVLFNCSCTGQWVTLAAMARPEGAVLRRIAEGDEPIEVKQLGAAWRVFYQKGIPSLRHGLEPRTAELLDAENAQSPEALWTSLTWHYPYEKLATIPAKITATTLSQELDGALSDPKALTPTFQRPRFVSERSGLTPAQRGTALHTVMQNIQLDRTKSVESIQAELRRLADEAYLSAQETASVQAERIYSFFSSNIGQQMCSAANLHREFPFSILIPADLYYEEMPPEERLLLQGVIDCWFETEEGITVLDFKTNRISAQAVEASATLYQRQLTAYAYALEALTGKRVAHKILWFLTPNCGISLSADGILRNV